MAVSILSKSEKIFKLLKSSFIYGITSSLQSLLGFIMLPILTSYYTPEIFGVYSILLLISAVSSGIFYLGASSALGRFYFEEGSESYKKKIITTSILITLCGAIILIILGFIFSKIVSFKLFETELYAFPILLILIGTALTFSLNIMTLILRYENKALIFFIVSIFGVMINFFITYFLLSRYNFGLLAPIYGLIFSNAICFIYLIFSKFSFLTKALEVSHFKLILSFGIQASIAGLFYYILDWVDRIIIKDLLDLSQVGIYSLGYRFGAIMNIILIMPFTLVWAPMRVEYAKNENNSSFSTKIISYYTIIGVLILVITILFGTEIIHSIFVNKSYHSATKIVPIIMFSTLFYGYQNIIDFGIYINKKVYYYIIILIFGIFINVTLNYLFIPIFGFMAAAFVTLITYILTSTVIYLISNKYYKINIENNRVFTPLILIPVLYLLVNYINNNMILKSIIFISIIISFFKFWLNMDEKKHLKKLFKI
jgi:O-antigen/teichoic acid export membrane protein